MTDEAVTREDLDECWCCSGLHDSPGTLCPNCDDAGCNRFTDDCKSDHQPALADGGSTTGEQAVKRDERIRALESSDLPIVSHTTVLGVHIAVRQEAIWAEVHEDGHRGGLDPDIDITVWQGERYYQHIRHELAAWARRNLFNGADPA